MFANVESTTELVAQMTSNLSEQKRIGETLREHEEKVKRELADEQVSGEEGDRKLLVRTRGNMMAVIRNKSAIRDSLSSAKQACRSKKAYHFEGKRLITLETFRRNVECV